MFNLTPLFTPKWFTRRFHEVFRYQCYILTQCRIFVFPLRFLLTLLTVKKIPKKLISFLSAFDCGFFLDYELKQ